MARSGSSYGWMSPPNGEYMSRMRRTTPATERADTNRLAATVAFIGAKRPKAAKTTDNQTTSTIKSDRGREALRCSYTIQRTCLRSLASRSASLRITRWASSLGASFKMVVHRLSPAAAGGSLSARERLFAAWGREGAKQIPCFLRFRTLVSKDAIEQDDFRAHVGELGAVPVERGVRGRDEEPEDQRRHRHQ